jgi:hypothetical protein
VWVCGVRFPLLSLAVFVVVLAVGRVPVPLVQVVDTVAVQHRLVSARLAVDVPVIGLLMRQVCGFRLALNLFL